MDEQFNLPSWTAGINININNNGAVEKRENQNIVRRNCCRQW